MRIRVLTDGKAGDDTQCHAVASGLASFWEKCIVPACRFRPGGRDPGRNSATCRPFPDIVIATGKRTVPYVKAIRKASGGNVRTVFLKDPRHGYGYFDVIWAPAHDGLVHPRAFSTLTGPHGLSARIAASRPEPASRYAKPVLGVLLGGGRGYTARAGRLFRSLLDIAARDYQGVVITPSRRTPGKFLEQLYAFPENPAFDIWDTKGYNPYTGILARAGVLVAPGDSHNMVSEALCTGAGVYVWKPPGVSRKLARFTDRLESGGAIRYFTGPAPVFSSPPLDETPRIIDEIVRRLGLRASFGQEGPGTVPSLPRSAARFP